MLSLQEAVRAAVFSLRQTQVNASIYGIISAQTRREHIIFIYQKH